jgi:hypothetical protein
VASNHRLDNILILTGILLVTLLCLLFIRGGGYGLESVSWTPQLEILNSTLTVSGDQEYPVRSGDRIVSVNNRPVFRNSDLLHALRTADTDRVHLIFERPTHEQSIPLTPEFLDASLLHPTLRGPYRVVELNGVAVTGEMNLSDLRSWYLNHPITTSIIKVEVPNWQYQGNTSRTTLPSPLIPVILLAFTLGLIFLSIHRHRSAMLRRDRRNWQISGLNGAMGGTLLAFIYWYDGFLSDPWILPFGLAAMAIWRPLSMLQHHLHRAHIHNTTPLSKWLMLLPPSVFFLASFFGWIKTVQEFYSPTYGGLVFDQLYLLVFLGALLVLAYHLIDTISSFLTLWRERLRASAMMWIPTLMGLLGILSVLLLSYPFLDSRDILYGRGFLLPLTALVFFQFLGDSIQLFYPQTPGHPSGPGEPIDNIPSLLSGVKQNLGLSNPQIVCRLDSLSITIELSEQSENFPETSSPLSLKTTEVQIDGFLELLEAEGGLYPRHKTVIGTSEKDEDPFEGLGERLSINFACPLPHFDGNDNKFKMSAFLLGRSETTSSDTAKLPEQDAFEQWRNRFQSSPQISQRIYTLSLERAVLILEGNAITSDQESLNRGDM